MGRIRTIKPEFPQSESVGRISRDARLCFILLWTVVDDDGRARASSRLLASLLYPYDDDARSLMDGWLAELAAEECIDLYTVDGSTYLQIRKWLNHQKIDHPGKSRLPAFDESSRILSTPRESLAPDLVPVPVPRTEDLGPVPVEETASPLAQTSPSESEPVAERKPFGTIPCNGTVKLFPFYEDDVGAWSEAFPGIDVVQQLRQCRQWNIDNPKRRKTFTGMRRSINSWLSRAQDAAGVTHGTVRSQGFASRDDRNLEVLRDSLRGSEAGGDQGAAFLPGNGAAGHLEQGRPGLVLEGTVGVRH